MKQKVIKVSGENTKENMCSKIKIESKLALKQFIKPQTTS